MYICRPILDHVVVINYDWSLRNVRWNSEQHVASWTVTDDREVRRNCCITCWIVRDMREYGSTLYNIYIGTIIIRLLCT